MKKLQIIAVCAIITACFSSCNKEEIADQNIQEEVAQKPTKAQLQKLANMGINIEDVTIEKIPMIDGSFEKHLVSGDITIPIANLDKYADLESLVNGNKQFRTPNIVAPQHRNIRILGYTGGSFALTSKMQTALNWAVFNYNVLPNTLNFTLSFGTNTAAADIVVYKVNGGAGGSAGFPTNDGKPYKWVRINSGTDALPTNVNEHVIGHEIGHCIGLRHQDWFNRQSCNYAGPLPAEPPAIWIFGTPFSPDEDSIMLACFDSSEDGEFTDSDKNALNILY